MVVYNKKVTVVLIKYHNAEISKTKRSYNIKLFGKTLANWTKEELRNLKPEVVLLNENNTLHTALKKYYNSADYIAVFYYDTPLLTETVATTCIDYAVLKDLDVCNLPKGFIFKTEFLRKSEKENEKIYNDENSKENINENESNLNKTKLDNKNLGGLLGYKNSLIDNNNLDENNIFKNENDLSKNKNNIKNLSGSENITNQTSGYTPNIQNFMHFESEFLQAYNLTNLKKVENAIRQKIINTHKNNGVLFVDETSVYIDYDCKIASGCVVYPNNFILNGSVVEKNCVLMVGNIIDGSVLQEGLSITYCVLTNSVVGAQHKLLPFSVLENNVLVK